MLMLETLLRRWPARLWFPLPRLGLGRSACRCRCWRLCWAQRRFICWTVLSPAAGGAVESPLLLVGGRDVCCTDLVGAVWPAAYHLTARPRCAPRASSFGLILNRETYTLIVAAQHARRRIYRWSSSPLCILKARTNRDDDATPATPLYQGPANQARVYGAEAVWWFISALACLAIAAAGAVGGGFLSGRGWLGDSAGLQVVAWFCGQPFAGPFPPMKTQFSVCVSLRTV